MKSVIERYNNLKEEHHRLLDPASEVKVNIQEPLHKYLPIDVCYVYSKNDTIYMAGYHQIYYH